MDYNYVRMRDALAAGDKKAAEHYRRLYEKSQRQRKQGRWMLIAIPLLLVIAAALGTYNILLSKRDEVAEQAAATELPQEIESPAVVSQPETEADGG